MSGRRSETSTLRVRYAETDQMGVVYHTHYLVWCEIGRTDYIRRLGVSYAELERQGLFLAVAEASIRYAGAARYDDPIRVETWVDAVQSRMITFRYEIVCYWTCGPRLDYCGYLRAKQSGYSSANTRQNPNGAMAGGSASGSPRRARTGKTSIDDKSCAKAFERLHGAWNMKFCGQVAKDVSAKAVWVILRRSRGSAAVAIP